MKEVALALLALSTCAFAHALSSEQRLVIRELSLSGVQHLSSAQQEAVVRGVREQENAASDVPEILERLRNQLQDLGYFKAAIGDSNVKVVSENQARKTIDISVEVDEGLLYRFGELEIRGATVLPASNLESQFGIRPGDVFAVSKIQAGLDHLRKLYDDRGYLNFTPVPDTEIDDANAVIRVTLDVYEGPCFRAGKMSLTGTETLRSAAEKLLEVWESYAGRPFGRGLQAEFVREAATIVEIGSYRLSPDEDTGLVNLTLTIVGPPN